jgi:hypothetical protein
MRHGFEFEIIARWILHEQNIWRAKLFGGLGRQKNKINIPSPSSIIITYLEKHGVLRGHDASIQNHEINNN